MNLSQPEVALIAMIAGLVMTLSLCRWGYLDAIAHDAGLAWRVIAALPILGLIAWIRFGRPRHSDPVV